MRRELTRALVVTAFTAVASGAAENAGGWVGTSISEAASVTNVTVLTAGDAWKASVTVGGREVAVAISVGQHAKVVTPAGTFQALPVTLQSELFDYVRWYAADVGLVREDSLVAGHVQSTKTLQRRIE
jgi:hypothetical protein